MEYGFASVEDVQKALETHTFLDVRTESEIAATGGQPHFIGQQQWAQTNCTPNECPKLEMAPESLIESKETPIVIYCRSGRRASKAKEILLQKGYKHVLNAGGYDDLVAILSSKSQ